MYIDNVDKLNFLLGDSFSFKSLLPFVKKEKNQIYTIQCLEISANQVLFDDTKNSSEIITIVAGKGGMTIDWEKSFLINTGDMLYIPKNTVRSFANIENETLDVIIIKL